MLLTAKSDIAEPRRLTPAVLALAVAGFLFCAASGCGGSGVHAQTGPVGKASATPTSSASTPSADTTRRQQAASAATAQVVAYEHALDELAIDTHLSLDRLYRVSTQPDVTNEIAFLNRFRSRGDRQHGTSKVTAFRVNVVHLPPSAGNQSATASVTICLDVGGVQAVDRAGKSIIAKGRKRFYLTRLELVNRKYPARDGWLVSHVSAMEQRSCSL